MDTILVLKAAAALASIGILAGVMLATASRKFHVEIDERVERILESLPGANCGACGSPSCFGAAEAVAGGRIAVTSCVAGGPSVAAALAQIMGTDSVPMEVVVSVRQCGGGSRATRRHTYSGQDSCNSVARLAGGDLTCKAGCFGYGDCVRACPFGAMRLDDRGLVVIDLVACTGCGVCIAECPRSSHGLLRLIPENGAVVVRCSAHDKPKDRKAYCSACCIACKKCEKACPSDAIHVVDLLAVVDYGKCTACGQCVSVCPPACIDITGRQALAPADSIDGCAADVAGFAPLEIARPGGAGTESSLTDAVTP